MISTLSICAVTTINRLNLKMSFSSFKSRLLQTLLQNSWLLDPLVSNLVVLFRSPLYRSLNQTSVFLIGIPFFSYCSSLVDCVFPRERFTFILLYVVKISVSFSVLPPLFLSLITSRCICCCPSLALTVHTLCSFHSHFSCYLSLLLPAYSTPSKSQPVSLITLFFSLFKTLGVALMFPLSQ